MFLHQGYHFYLRGENGCPVSRIQEPNRTTCLCLIVFAQPNIAQQKEPSLFATLFVLHERPLWLFRILRNRCIGLFSLGAVVRRDLDFEFADERDEFCLFEQVAFGELDVGDIH